MEVQILAVITIQPVCEIPGTSSEGPPKVLTSGTSRGSPGDIQETLRGPIQKLVI